MIVIKMMVIMIKNDNINDVGNGENGNDNNISIIFEMLYYI